MTFEDVIGFLNSWQGTQHEYSCIFWFWSYELNCLFGQEPEPSASTSKRKFLLSKPSADRNAEKWKQIQKYHLSRSGARFKRPVVHAVEEKSSLKKIYLYWDSTRSLLIPIFLDPFASMTGQFTVTTNACTHTLVHVVCSTPFQFESESYIVKLRGSFAQRIQSACAYPCGSETLTHSRTNTKTQNVISPLSCF